MEGTDDYSTYDNPLVKRYASKEMSFLWSPKNKFTTWRKLWVALAKCEKELGVNITDEQIKELEDNIDNINYQVAEEREKECRHDVMSHVYAYGVVCPLAKGIIHLGATSCYVTDNSELIMIKSSLELIKRKLLQLINALSGFCSKYKDMPTLGFTHLQPAQLVTVGKRGTLWLFDILNDYNHLIYELENLYFRGCKGTTGTQASFMELFDNDSNKVKQLDINITKLMGFNKSVPVCGQTYTRKIDINVLNILCNIGSSLHKMSTDIRLLMSMKEIEEPFGKNQIGSSAMAYKRNPMKSERICSISRYLMNLNNNAYQTHSLQWFERSLDDSANRRIILGEGFISTDIIITTAIDILNGIVVYPNIINLHIDNELPFMSTEVILMYGVKKGGDRQILHEAIRELSMIASNNVKQHGLSNNLIELIKNDNRFSIIHEDLDNILDPKKFIGRSIEQVDEFINDYITPILNDNKELLNIENVDKVTV